MKYAVYEFFTKDETERDWLVAILGNYHFEGFEETSESLKAYVPAEKARTLHVKEVLFDNDFSHIRFTETLLEEKNWNEEWEKNFEPVAIAERVSIRAPFHAPLNTKYEIVIEPKMSFGTGHHATTASVVELMLKQDFKHKQVLDFGSGTGVLAILAEKLNAAKIVAIDNEVWAYNNCLENTANNNCVNITCLYGDDTHSFAQKFDVILANINRHVILQNMAKWKELLNDKGLLIVSGILQSDEQPVMSEANRIGLVKNELVINNGWLAIAFHRP
ncbi:MAG: 50S ribosomal protein L11 methyltransferase [Chitinophagales bacterium]|nr:50S ribosomal protein L11 methyltransferase [Chitinophagales bacterium]